MIRFALLAILFHVKLTGAAMARDTGINDLKVNTPAQDVVSSENVSDQWERSPKGQFSAQLNAMRNRGEITFEDRVRLFRERFPDTPPPPYLGPRRTPERMTAPAPGPTGPMPPMQSFE